MNQQILEEYLWNGDGQTVLTRISSLENKRFMITLRIDKNGTGYLDSFTCYSKNVAIRCFELINICVASIYD